MPGEFPHSPVQRVLFFLIPIIGLTVIIERIVDFAWILRDRRRYERNWCLMMASSMQNHIVLVGLGEVGLRTYNVLHQLGEQVVVIERNAENWSVHEGGTLCGRTVGEVQAELGFGVAQHVGGENRSFFPPAAMRLAHGDEILVQGPYEELAAMQRKDGAAAHEPAAPERGCAARAVGAVARTDWATRLPRARSQLSTSAAERRSAVRCWPGER